MFHLFTHAFFKALLFLGAGSVMHAMGGRDRHAPLRRPAAADADHALDVPVRLPGPAGVFPLAGFWSKDAILAAVARARRTHDAAVSRLLYWRGVFTAFLTALLHVPRVFPHVLRPRAGAARGRPSCPRVAAGR